jgi:hypothetical protein
MSIEQRIDCLERDNRYLKRLLIGCLLSAGAVVAMGQAARPTIPDVVRAKAFEVIDQSGRLALKLNSDNGNGVIGIYSKKGDVLLFIGGTAESGGVLEIAKDTRPLVRLKSTENGEGAVITFDKRGEGLVEIGADRNSGEGAIFAFTRAGGVRAA